MRYFLIALVISACPATPGLDGGRLHTSRGVSLHWAQDRFPIPVVIHPGMPQRFKDAARTGADIWEGAVGLKVFRVYEGSDSFHMFNGGPPHRGYVSIEGAKDLGFRGPLRIRGLAEVHQHLGAPGERGEIHSTHVFFLLDRYSDEDAVALAVHELGHCLGLAHDMRDEGSIMWLSARPEAYIQPEDILYVRDSIQPP